jgi:hypothetical protein
MDNEGKSKKWKGQYRFTIQHLNGSFFLIAEMADKTGIDLWSFKPHQANPSKRFEARPYINKEKMGRTAIKEFDYEETLPIDGGSYSF